MAIGKVREFNFSVVGNSDCTFVKTAKKMSVTSHGRFVRFFLISSAGERLKECMIWKIILVTFSYQQVSQGDTTLIQAGSDRFISCKTSHSFSV